MKNRILSHMLVGFGILASAWSPSFSIAKAQTGDEPELCDFSRTKLDAFSLKQPEVRARLAAIDWVRYNYVANSSTKVIAELGQSGKSDRNTDIAIVGLILLANLREKGEQHYLHACFAEAFDSSEIYIRNFRGTNLSRSASKAEIPYAVVEPNDKRLPIFIVTPSTSYNYYQRTGEMTTFDPAKDTYVGVDPRARRWVERVVQEHIEQLKQK